MENNYEQIPYEIAIDEGREAEEKDAQYIKDLVKLFKEAMDHNRKTIKVNGGKGRKIAGVLK
ncbi:MAG: hypothetical protein AAFP88_02760 [Bacteroidota bacterium]